MTILPPPLPPLLGEYGHINRYWDKHAKIWVAKILPGEIYISQNAEEAIATTLGSCISACIRDKKGIGGMNHFMLPENTTTSPSANNYWMGGAARYGCFAMECLINEILKAGGERKDLEMKVCGGGRILSGISNDVGKKNSEFVLKFAEIEGISVKSYDLGDIYPRKVIFFPYTGKLFVKRIKHLHNDTILTRETEYKERLQFEYQVSTAELF